MTALNRKLQRDLLGMKTQAVAIALVIAAGIATFVMSLSTISALQRMRDQYYDRHRFAQVFAHLKRAPNSLGARLAEIPGVSAVQTRVVVEVTLDIPGLLEAATGRLVSIPEQRRPGMNRIHLRQGRFPEPGRPGEVIANEAFAEAHGFQPGSEVRAVINSRLQSLRIVGVGLSPEFVYSIRPGDLWPDDKRFGVLWMGESELAAAHGLEGAFNDVCLTTMPGSSEPEIIRQVDRLLAAYGGQGAYGREDQVSHQYVRDEMKQFRAMASVAPVICLAIAAFLLHVVITRLIQTQREQIGALKAFGYSAGEIGIHYLTFVLIIVIAGVLLGVGAGAWLGRNLTSMYAQFFRFPSLEFALEPRAVLASAALAFVAALSAVITALRMAMKLPAAEAMRPEPPATFRPLLIERFGLQRWFGPTTRMILRRLERRPWRALLSSLGLALAMALLTLGTFTKDIVDYVNELQFHLSQRQDLNVSLVEPAGPRALTELAHRPGVLRAEPYRSVPVRLRAAHRSHRVALMGVDPDGDLFRLFDLNRRRVNVPAEGLVLSGKLAEQLGLRPGDPITVEVLEGERPVRRTTVTDVMDDFSGTGVAYLDRRALNRLMREGPLISGAFLAIDQRRSAELHRALKETPRIASVSSQRTAQESFLELMSEHILVMRLFNIAFACVIAFGVVYNTARITLSEQSRDLATLRVIGLTRGEISTVLLGEIGGLTLAAIPAGLALGYGLCALAIVALETETQRFPLVIAPATYGFAVTVVLVATLLSSLVVRRRLDRLDLVAVLKAPE